LVERRARFAPSARSPPLVVRIAAYPRRKRSGINAAPDGGLKMKKYVIERDIPGVDALTVEQLKGAAAASNAALAQLAPKVQWVESFVVKDKTFCLYLAEDEAVIREHARLSGFPATRITEVAGTISPTTAAS
jgi:hypothetical protein